VYNNRLGHGNDVFVSDSKILDRGWALKLKCNGRLHNDVPVVTTADDVGI
jgi:hypothetical protein